MNNRNYENTQFLHKPSDWATYTTAGLKEFLKFTEDAYNQLVYDTTVATEVPGCIKVGRVYFGMDQAVSAPVYEVLENIISWYQFYEEKLYGEVLTPNE